MCVCVTHFDGIYREILVIKSVFGYVEKIVVYEAAGRYRFQGPRRFRGHTSAGYAILPGFSPDGRFIMSGDASGRYTSILSL